MDKNVVNIGWNFDNSYINLPDTLYTKAKLNPVSSPKLVILNKDLASDLGLNIDGLLSPKGVNILAGNRVPIGGDPISQAYAGHQFGHFTMLGDGRAILLGEHITPAGKRYDIQLKGSGRTIYSRGGDGRAALGPMLREYIISEAMHGLGIPSSRSLAVVETGEKVYRESPLAGAILTRVAESHIRVGTFQYISTFGSFEELKELADYTIERHFLHIKDEKTKYILFLREVVKRQAKLISKWQLVGFIHGVMNTDNVAISGQTIDYGPCAFMDVYNPKTVFSSIDRQGRYRYENQPIITVWNLFRFAESILPLLDEDQEEAMDIAEKCVEDFSQIYNELWKVGMRRKLGLFKEEYEDETIIVELLSLMKKHKADFTNTFRSLTLGEFCGMKLFDTEDFSGWRQKWEKRLKKEGKSKEEVFRLMKDNNPSIIPRNYLVEEALEAAVKDGDYSKLNRLVDTLSDPYGYSKEQEAFAKLPPEPKTPYRTFCGT